MFLQDFSVPLMCMTLQEHDSCRSTSKLFETVVCLFKEALEGVCGEGWVTGGVVLQDQHQA